MATQFILLWFEAPLQAWGSDSKFGRRDTLEFPTKSGVLGLLLSALGASGEQRDLLESLSELRQTIVSYISPGKSKEPLLRDFQMVGAGYNVDGGDLWQDLLIPKKSDGSRPVGGGTKMTYRYYLQDAKFAVILEVIQDRSTEFAQSLINPVYDLFLGRKTCIPTDFIYRGVFDTESEALEFGNNLAKEKKLVPEFKVIDGESEEGDSFTLNDVPVQFGEVKKYRDRRVTKIAL